MSGHICGPCRACDDESDLALALAEAVEAVAPRDRDSYMACVFCGAAIQHEVLSTTPLRVGDEMTAHHPQCPVLTARAYRAARTL